MNARWRPDRRERCRTGRSPVSCESAAAARAIFDSHPAWRGCRSKLGSGHPFSGRCGQRTSFDHHHEHVHLWPSEPRGAFGQSSPRPPRHADGTEQLPEVLVMMDCPHLASVIRERELRVRPLPWIELLATAEHHAVPVLARPLSPLTRRRWSRRRHPLSRRVFTSSRLGHPHEAARSSSRSSSTSARTSTLPTTYP